MITLLRELFLEMYYTVVAKESNVTDKVVLRLLATTVLSIRYAFAESE